MTLQWNGDQVMKQMRSRLGSDVQRALQYLVTKIQENIDTAYPPASSPGDPPHLRTGDLERSVDYARDWANQSGNITVSAPYAEALEYGTANMAARPFLRPTIAAETTNIIDILKGA